MGFLSGFAWWQIALTFALLVGTLVAAVLVLIRYVRTSRVNLKFGKGGLSLDPEDPETAPAPILESEPSSPRRHEDCHLRRDILLIIEYQTEAIKKISHIEDVEIIKEQMHGAEELISAARDLLRKRFLRLLKNTIQTKVGLITTHEAGIYDNVLRILSQALLDHARFTFRENGLSKKSEAEFEPWLVAKVKHIHLIITELLNDIYPPETSPSREEVYDANEDIIPQIGELLEALLRRGRIVELEKDAEIVKIREQLSKRIESILGPEG